MTELSPAPRTLDESDNKDEMTDIVINDSSVGVQAPSPRDDVPTGGVMKGSFWVQTYMLVWKNIKLKRKRPISTISEVLLPVFVTLFLSWVRTASFLQPKSVPISTSSFLFNACIYEVFSGYNAGFSNDSLTSSDLSSLDCTYLNRLSGSIVIIPNNSISNYLPYEAFFYL